MPDLQTILLIIIASAVAPKAVLFVMQFVPMPAKLAEAIKKLAANGNGNIKKEIVHELEINHFHEVKDGIKELTSEFREQDKGEADMYNVALDKKTDIFKASESDVYECAKKLNVKNIKVVKGWIEDTLPDKIEKIAILRIDIDLYEPTKHCLEKLYDKVSLGGWWYLTISVHGKDAIRRCMSFLRSTK